MGHLGLTCAAMCKDVGTALIATPDIDKSRLTKSLQFGADSTIDLSEIDALNNEAKLLPDNKKADIVFDMSGSPVAMEMGLKTLAICSTAVWVGAVFNTREAKVNPEYIIRNLIAIKGLHNYNFEDFKYALHFMEHNWQNYPFRQVVEKEFLLKDAKDAFEYAIKNKPSGWHFVIGFTYSPSSNQLLLVDITSLLVDTTL